MIRIGVDLDNTLVCCDSLFCEAAVSRGWVPSRWATHKTAIRNYLRNHRRENEWTELQGFVYGVLLPEAPPYPGCLSFFSRCRDEGIPVQIISHKTQRPFIGPPYDLHAAAYAWLKRNGFFSNLGLSETDIFLELTKEDKWRRIQDQGCTCFVDDLPEFLMDPLFPDAIHRLLFDPQNAHPEARAPGLTRLTDWQGILQWILNSVQA